MKRLFLNSVLGILIGIVVGFAFHPYTLNAKDDGGENKYMVYPGRFMQIGNTRRCYCPDEKEECYCVYILSPVKPDIPSI